MKTEVLLFVSQFAMVFLLGLQSLNVRDNAMLRAASTSALIGLAQLFQWKIMPRATPTEMFSWWVAGPLAIVACMVFYKRVFRK